MTPKINLIANRNNESTKQKKVFFLFQTSAIISLAVVLLLAVGLFLYKLKLTTDTNTVLATQKTDLATLQTLHPRLAKLLILNDRSVDIKKILANRTTFESHIAKLLAQTPDSVTYTSLSLDKKTLTMTVTSQSLSSINTYIENLMGMVNRKDILKSIKLESLTEDPTQGQYTVSLSADI